MASNRYDRQNRVYGFESTMKIQQSHVIIFGEKCDLLFEVAKNLVLSGVNKISIHIKQIDHIYMTNNNNFFGNIINISYDRIITELSQLNPHCFVQTFNIDDIDDITNSICVFINYDIDLVIKLNNLYRSSMKSIVIMNDNNEFKIYNDFNIHTVYDTNGETYMLSTLVSIENNIITTQENHNLYNGDLIEIDYFFENNNYKLLTSVYQRINTHKFSLNNNKEDFNFNYGNIKHIKQHITFNHVPFDKLFDNKNITYNKFSNINPIIQYFLGAVVSSECIKAITNKYIPFDQSYTFTFEEELLNIPSVDIFNNLNILIVGAGAIGCELLKNLASLNCHNIFITDPDHIELSNLSRQFLFREDNIGESKSKISANRIKYYNSYMNIIPFEEKLCVENQTFANNIFPKIDIVFNALDNLQARLYVDSQIIYYKKPLFESGTLGVVGNIQPIIPHITESYGASKDQNVETSYAVCTIKHFPSTIHHTIHYAIDNFNGIFVKWPEMIKTYIESYDLSSQDSTTVHISSPYSTILYILSQLKNINDYIEWAYTLWYDDFNLNIRKLLDLHPINEIQDDGKYFWSAGKRCPIPINQIDNIKFFNEYMIATTSLLLDTYRPKFNYSINELKKNILDFDYNITDFRFNIDIDIIDFLPNILNYEFDINSQIFEKDNDDNNHINYIHYTSLFRAMNYNIPACSFEETKGIAGKIIPALATTTSIVSSLIVLEMLKYVLNPKRPIHNYNSYFVNIANNIFIPGEPLPPAQLDLNGYKYTEWDMSKFIHNTNCTLQEFINIMTIEFDCKIIGIIAGVKIIYDESCSEYLYSNLSEIINSYSDEFVLITEPDFDIPIIRIKL